MEYAEALKKIQTKKPRENYMLIEISYGSHILLPYKDGLIFLGALVNAENLSEEYGKPHRITSLDRSTVKCTILSAEEYEQHKIAGLLNVSLQEVKDAAKTAE